MIKIQRFFLSISVFFILGAEGIAQPLDGSEKEQIGNAPSYSEELFELENQLINLKTAHAEFNQTTKLSGNDIYQLDSIKTSLWDSNGDETLYKKEYYYTPSNTVGFIEFSKIKIEDPWEMKTKDEKSTNENGLVVLHQEFIYDPESQNWINKMKTVREYEDNENETHYSKRYWNGELNTWTGGNKHDIKYDDENREVEWHYYHGITNSEDWKERLRGEAVFNSKGDTISYYSLDWNDILNKWQCGLKCIENQYDDLNRVVKVTQNTWDNESSQLTPNKITDYTYDDSNFKTEELQTVVANSAKSKIEYTKDDQGRKVQSVKYDWDAGSEIWIKNNRTSVSYEAPLTTDSLFAWNGLSSEWEISSKTEKTNLPNNGLLEERYNWNAGLKQWDKTYLHEVNRSSSDLITFFRVYSNWDWVRQDWNFFYELRNEHNQHGSTILDSLYVVLNGNVSKNNKTEWHRDEHDNLLERIEYVWDADQQKTVNSTQFIQEFVQFPKSDNFFVSSTEFNDWKNSDWEPSSSNLYYYSEIPIEVLSSKMIDNQLPLLFPNPFTNYVTFNISPASSLYKLEIFDLRGQLIFEQLINSHEQIPLESLEEGLYTYLVSDSNGKVLRGKMLKE